MSTGANILTGQGAFGNYKSRRAWTIRRPSNGQCDTTATPGEDRGGFMLRAGLLALRVQVAFAEESGKRVRA